MIPYNPAVIHAGCESIQHTDYNQSITDNSDLKKYLHKSGMAYKSISKKRGSKTTTAGLIIRKWKKYKMITSCSRFGAPREILPHEVR